MSDLKRLTNEEGRATIMLTDDHDYTWGGDETVDIGDLKSPERKLVWVRVPPALLSITGARCVTAIYSAAHEFYRFSSVSLAPLGVSKSLFL